MSLSSVFGYLVIIAAAVCLDVAVLRWRRRDLPREQPKSTRAIVEQWLRKTYRQIIALTAARLPNREQRQEQPPVAVNKPSRPAAASPLLTSSEPVAATAPLQPSSGRPPAGDGALAHPSAATLPEVAIAPRVLTSLEPAGRLVPDPANGLARVSVSVELPVGATIRLTIETSAGIEPRVTVESSQRQWAPSTAPAEISTPLALGLNPGVALPTPRSSAPSAAPEQEVPAEPALEPTVERMADPKVEFMAAPTLAAEPSPESLSEPESHLPALAALPSLADAPNPELGTNLETSLRSELNASVSTSGPLAGAAPGPKLTWRQQLGQAWRTATDIRDQPLTMVLFGLSIAAYILTRFIGLDRFPIYFFTDEAVQTLQAASLVAHGFRDSFGYLLPTYFQNGVYFNLSLSVYAQVVPYLLFGKSIWVTRGVPALLSILAPVSASLALKTIFRARWWWLGALLLVITPAWFLHSRTGFETVLMVALYACFLYSYLLYRYRGPVYLYPALLFGALAFYSYNGGQLTVVITGLLFLISDFRYHWENRQTGWRGLAFLAVLVLPYVRFTLQHPGAAGSQLRTLDSYWLRADFTLPQKLGQFFSEYTFGLSPQFWFAADNGRDLIRHVMKGYGHISIVIVPFLLVGLFVCLRKFREPAYRVLLITLLAAPVSGAITSVGITRVLVFVLPLALVTAVGLETLWNWLPVRPRWSAAAAVGIFAAMSVFGFAMLRDALENGPVWYADYELGGMQWGARQLFAEQIPAWLARDPALQAYISPSWANGTELFPEFFLTSKQLARVQLQGVAYYLAEKRDLPPDLLVVLPAEEYAQVDNNPKIVIQKVEQILPYPNGQPGFYFLRLAYSDQAEAIFAQEKAALLRPITETISLDGQDVAVTHPRFGAGQLHDMLDGDAFTLVNAPSFNPLVLDFAFPAPRAMSGLTLITGSLPDFTVKLSLYAEAGSAPQVYTQHYVGLPPDPTVKIDFSSGPPNVARLQLEIMDNINNGPGVNIHVREVEFR